MGKLIHPSEKSKDKNHIRRLDGRRWISLEKRAIELYGSLKTVTNTHFHTTLCAAVTRYRPPAIRITVKPGGSIIFIWSPPGIKAKEISNYIACKKRGTRIRKWC
jgi:hypothetical protein